MMKHIYNICAMVLALAMGLSACSKSSDDDKDSGSATVQQRDFVIDPNEDVIATPTVSFDATGNWTLYSDEIWCQVEKDGVRRNSLSGAAGHHEVKIVANAKQADATQRKVTLRLLVGGNTYTVATVTLGQLAYRGLVVMDNESYRSKDGKVIALFESGDSATLSANYDYVLRMPAWCAANGNSSFEGKSGVTYPVLFTFVESAGTDPRYATEGEIEMLSPDGSISDKFRIAYMGMNKLKADVAVADGPHGETLTPWNWLVDFEAGTCSHINSRNEEVKLTDGIPFVVTCRDDKMQFAFATKNGSSYDITPTVDYAEVSGAVNKYTFKLTGKGDTPSAGMLMAFSEAAWDTIKANPKEALLEYDEETQSYSLKYSVNNNIAVSWNRRVVTNTPVVAHHTQLYNDDWSDFRYYEFTQTSDYYQIFGTDNVWEMSIDPSNVRLCVELKDYDNSWFGSMRIGFDRKLNIPLDEIAENGSCDWHQTERPAFKLYLAGDQLTQLAQSPLYIAVVNPTTKEVTGIVIKAE